MDKPFEPLARPLPPPSPSTAVEVSSILEEGITAITLDNNYENEDFVPLRGLVKWFRDELGQLWVKFLVNPPHSEDILCLVWPADKVVCCEYDKTTAIQWPESTPTLR